MTRREYLETAFGTFLTERLLANNPQLTQLTEQLTKKELVSKLGMIFRVNSETKSGWLFRGQLSFVPDAHKNGRGFLYGCGDLIARKGDNSPSRLAGTDSVLGQHFTLAIEISLPWLPTEEFFLLKLEDTVFCSFGALMESDTFEIFDGFRVRGVVAEAVPRENTITAFNEALALEEVKPFIVSSK